MIKTALAFSMLFLTPQTFAFVNPNAFQSSYVEVEEAILRYSLGAKSKGAKSAIHPKVLDVILNDKKNLIDKDFDIPPYFSDSTKFWFSIYSQYTSHQVVIHDKENLGLVYTVIDFEPLHESSINRFAKSKLQADLALEKANRIKSILGRLHLPEEKLNSEELGILKTILNSGIEVPNGNRKERQRFFRNLSTTLRTQTGQRDMVLAGVLRSLPFLPFLEKQFKNFGIPKELLSIAFVESSFNLKAISYAGAAGIWQFMPRTAASFMPARSRKVDYRVNPIIASVAAMHLLKQNKQILKRWDLAVPAYNFGTSHLVRARRKYKEKATLARILQNYEHANVGFASKNYYAEVLAMARVLAYKDMIFPLSGYKKKGQKLDQENISIYVTKCSLKPKTYFNLLKKSSPLIQNLNAHFLKTKTIFKPRQLVVSDRNLTSKKYRKITDKELLKYYPKNLYKLTRNERCRR